MKLKLALVCLSLVGFLFSVSGQIIQPIWVFTNGFNAPRSPLGPLTLGPDGNFYGTTQLGGTGSFGTIFRVTINGAFSVIANLDTSHTGADPSSPLTLGPDGNFYGTTTFVGPKGAGTVFRVTTNGTVTVIASFSSAVWSGSALTNMDGDTPQGGVIFGPDGCLYGTTIKGGAKGGGTIFRLTTNGLLTTLFALSGTNGSGPKANMTLGPDGALYGTTYDGGTNNASDGVVFKITTNGVFTKLVDFNNANGTNPQGTMVIGPDGNLYGTTVNGGSGADGTVFKLTTNGVLTTIVPFDYRTANAPMAGLTPGPDGYLYGILSLGDSGGGVFRTTTNGTWTILANFGTNGSEPKAPMTLGPDGNFYGTTFLGGPSGSGVIYRFSLPLPPTNQLTGITLGTGGIVILSVAGTPSSTNRLWATTNLNLPIDQWQVLATNITTNGFFQFQDINSSGNQMKFYRVSTP